VRQSYKDQRLSLTAKQAELVAKKKKVDEIKISVVSSVREESKRDSASIASNSFRETNQSFSKQLAWGNLSKSEKVDQFESFLDKLKEEK
jgi:thymidylate synthase